MAQSIVQPPIGGGTQETPDQWSCESPQKRVRVEVMSGGRVVEIPTQQVEYWANKAESTRIKRTAKVRFPTEWAGDSPRDVVETFDVIAPTAAMEARVSFKQQDGTYVLAHHGWVGGVGGTSDENVSKLWIYDYGEFLDKVPFGGNLDEKLPFFQILERVLGETVDRTPIPVVGAAYIGPNASTAPEPLSPSPDSDDTLYSIFVNTETASAGGGQLLDGPVGGVTAIGDGSGLGNEVRIGSFTSNHDTLLDFYHAVESKTNSKLHFEPVEGGVVLVVDHRGARGGAYYRRQFRQTDAGGDVVVLNNDALYEMVPQNTLYLRGEFAAMNALGPESRGGSQEQREEAMESGTVPTETYPSVKVTVEPLIEAANGVELSGPVVESDAEMIDTARAEAIRTLDGRIDETTEGEVVLGGDPRILPYDRLDAFEVCNEQVQFEQTPVPYEVESVKHEVVAGQPYRTRLTVGILITADTVTVEASQVEGTTSP